MTSTLKDTGPPDHASRRRFALQMQQQLPRSTVFDRAAFLVGTASAVWLAILITLQGFSHPWSVLLFIPVWAIMAYLVLPRLHRMLSDLYVPKYFFGRTRTADGLLGDPVNLGVDGRAAQLDTAMAQSGWHRADPITAASTWRIIVSTLTRRSYPTAPVSPLMLFGRRHDLAYQQEVEGNPKQRHHVRFWHCPPGWLLPGGAKTDWLGAATYDTDVGLSLFTLQVTHHIDENTDEERNYIVDSVRNADSAVGLRVLKDFTTGYHSRNGGGDRFITDGNLPILNVSRVTVQENASNQSESHETAVRAAAHEIARRVPLSVIVAVACIVLSEILRMLSILFDKKILALRSLDDVGAVIYGIFAVILLLLALGQVVLAWFVLRRGRKARAALMIVLFGSIVVVAIDYLDGTAALGLNSPLLSASLMCLALLALSSDSAGAWARRSGRRKGEANPSVDEALTIEEKTAS